MPHDRHPSADTPLEAFVRQCLGFLAVWAVLALGSTAVVYAVAPLPLEAYERADVRAKLAGLAALERVDTVFVGSSRVFRHIDPVRFDAGRDTVSVNLGAISLLPPRTDDVLDAAVARRPDARRWVLELQPLALVGANWKAEPNVRSFTLERAPLVADYIATVPMAPATRGQYAIGYLKLGAYKAFGFGAARALGAMARPPEPPPEGPDPWSHRGFVSLETAAAHDPALAARHQAFVAQLARQGGDLRAGVRTVELPEGPVATRFVDARVERAEALRAAGHEVVFFVPPRRSPDALAASVLLQRALEARGFVVLDFDDPERFPDLFEEAVIFDAGHFNDRGAERFTDHLRAALDGLERSP